MKTLHAIFAERYSTLRKMIGFLPMSASGLLLLFYAAAAQSQEDFTIDQASVTIYEGESSVSETFTVRLAANPSADVTVTLEQPSDSSNSDVTFTPTSLTFTSGSDGNWNETQEVTVTAQNDSDGIDDKATINLSADAGGYDDVTGRVMVTVKDSDHGIFVSKSSLDVPEKGEASFTVRLNRLPTSSVSINLEKNPSSSDVDFSPTGLTFNSSNWNMERTVTVTAPDDEGGVDERATLRLRGGSQYQADVSLVVKDDDVAALILSRKVMTVVEEASETFTVALAIQPDDDVSVTVTKGSDDKITLSTSEALTFNRSNWNTAQEIRVTATDDSDDGSATVTLTASNGGYDSITDSVSVSLKDGDTAGLVAPASLSINEDGSGIFRVRLTMVPSASVTVDLTQAGTANSDVTFDTDPDSTGNQSELTFTTTDWSAPKSVTVSAAEDSDASNDTAMIKLSASGGGYDNVTDGSVTITVNDDDTAGLDISEENLSLTEDSSDTFSVRLTSRPSEDVTVTLAQPTNTDVTLDTDSSETDNQTTLTFTAANWETNQPVTVTAADDADALPDTATISLTAAGGGYASVTGSVSVSVADKDIQLNTASSMSPDEEKTTNLNVSLSGGPPSHNIYVRTRIGLDSSRDVTRDEDHEYLVFTPANWNVNQQVAIIVAEDPDAVDEKPSTLELTASGFGYEIDNETVDINAKDVDVRDLIPSPENLTINEGETATFDISLERDGPLGDDERLEIFVRHPFGISIDTDESSGGNQNTLIFTSSNWNQPQTIEVTANRDENDVVDEATITFGFSGTANYEGTSKTQMKVTLTDSSTQTLILSKTELTITENGESGEFTIRLTSQPSGNVTVTLTPPTNNPVQVDTDPDNSGNQNTLTFTTDNWRVPQKVMVSAIDDDDAVNETADIVVTASGGGYDIGADDDVEVMVTANDDDEAGLTVSTSYLAINEDESGTFTVRLATEPSVDVTVTVGQGQSPNNDVTIDTNTGTAGIQSTLTFTRSNWSAPQTVTVSAAEDSDSSEDEATISISAAGGEYANLDAVEVEVDVGDSDAEKVIASMKDMMIDEGEQSTFSIRLTKLPTDAVTVTLVQPSNSEVTVDTVSGTTGNQNTLTFDDTDWNEWKSVTVRAAEDDDDEDDAGIIIRISAEGGGYTSGNSSASVTVEVKDDDEKGLTLSAGELSINEGANVPLGVRLSAIPNGDVTVTFTPPSNSDVSVDTDPAANGNQNTLTFTSSNWNDEQEVTVAAAADDDALDDRATLVISVSGSNYNNIENVEVSVSVIESDTAVMTVSPTSLEIIEGQGDTLTVSLSAPPAPSSENVTISLTRTGSTDVIFTPETLTFTASNWNAAQTVGVNAAHDEDEVADSATITLTASGGGYDDIDAITVSVSVPDDDAPGITTFPRSLSIVEGRSGFFVVRLAKQPTADVTLTFAQPSDTDVTLDTDPGTPGNQNTLEFTSASWSTPQGIAVSVAVDRDTEDDTTSISISAAGATEYRSVTTQVSVEATEGIDPGRPLTWNIRSSAPAIPPPSAQDSSTLRIRCREASDECDVYLDCSAQDGTFYHGPTPPLTISSWNTEVLTVANIVDHVGDWSGQGRGRLTCSVRSLEDISTQIWTRSGDGVLVNNSAMLRSVESQNAQGNATHQVDIESIPSPDDTVNRSNIRIRCESSDGDCNDVTFVCYEDDGRLYSGVLGTVESKHTRHLQAPELADIIDHRWTGMGFTCEVGTNAPFSVQILTRTGGGGALVNNSASGGL